MGDEWYWGLGMGCMAIAVTFGLFGLATVIFFRRSEESDDE